MPHVTEAPSAHANSASTTPRADLDRAVSVVRENRTKFVRMPAKDRALLLRSALPALVEASRAWVEAGCKAKGIRSDEPLAGEEWFAGPLVTARNLRLLAKSVEQIASSGRPPLGRSVKTRPDGRIEVDVFPAGGFDTALYRGLSCAVLMQAGVDERAA